MSRQCIDVGAGFVKDVGQALCVIWRDHAVHVPAARKTGILRDRASDRSREPLALNRTAAFSRPGCNRIVLAATLAPLE